MLDFIQNAYLLSRSTKIEKKEKENNRRFSRFGGLFIMLPILNNHYFHNPVEELSHNTIPYASFHEYIHISSLSSSYYFEWGRGRAGMGRVG